MSGLTVGYLSIDKLILEIKETNGTEEEKKYVIVIRQKEFDRLYLNTIIY